MRRRLVPSFNSEQMERGTGKGHNSRLFCLASLTAFFWILLLYSYFSILGRDSVDKPSRLQSEISPFGVESAPRKLVPSRVIEVKKPDVKSKHEHLENPPPDYSKPDDNDLVPSRVIEVKKPDVKSKHEHLENPPPDHSKSDDNDLVPSQVIEVKKPDVKSKHEENPPPDHSKSVDNELVPSQVIEVKKPDVKSKHEHLENPPPDHSKSVDNEKTLIENLNRAPPTAGDYESDGKEKTENYPFMRALRTVDNKSDPCGGRYIYVHNLPSRFNEDMLKECRSLSMWTNMCKFTTNAGMGPPLENTDGVFSNTGWYATNQFAVDVIFGNRMKQYECLTNDSSIAAATFVPFYAGFDISRYLWGYEISTRDASSLDLVDWLTKRPEWKTMGGRDHFLVAGRITWDFRRLTEKESDWGSKLLFLPAAKNMSMLVVESSPWNSNDFGIPYPTYFHPAKDSDVFTWQDRMRNLDRKWLFSFAGAPRPGMSESIRGQIIEQCKNSKVCKLLKCDILEESKCHSPSYIMQMFQSSIFCLQPQGDSYTRRSAFDSMLAGCIPVFFHPGSAYVQYTWHLPKNYTKYSVFIPEDEIRKRNVSIEEWLGKISAQQVKNMREEVINLIPRLVYADPRSKLETLKDAFDVSVQAIIDKVTQLRKDIIEGRRDDDFIEEYSWKYLLLEGQQKVGAHEWDPFFSLPKDGNSDSNNSSAVAAKNSWKNEQRNQS